MQVILQPVLPSEGSSIVVDTNSGAILSSLISSYCAQKGLKFSGNFIIKDDKGRPLPLYSTLGTLGIGNGQTLLIGKEEPSFSVFTEWPIIIAFAALLIGFIGILTMSLVYGLKGGEYFDDYGVVMDAGSSKTNTIVYKWRSSKHKGTGCVSQEDYCKAQGGIAKMDPWHLEPVINCTKHVTSVIAPESLSRTPLFFAATAGMRLLKLTNPQKVEEILKNLAVSLPETGLDIRAIEIISGRDEGIYGWITSNFLLKTLEQLQTTEPTTYGALDMGGASMQISYALPPPSNSGSLGDTQDVNLYGQTFNVFSQSNLCFGRDEANNRYYALLTVNRTNNVIEEPCAPVGFNKIINHTDLFDPICSRFYQDNTTSKENITYTFTGTSNPDLCNKKVSQLLNDTLCKQMGFKECFKKHLDISGNQKFLAFAAYFFTTNFLNVTNTTYEEFKDAMNSYCRKNYDEVRNLSEYAAQYCFNAQYIHEILTNGFGFSNSTWKNLEFVGQIADKDVGWTLGYMINATNIIPEKTTPRLISKVALTLSIVLFIIVIIATAVFLFFTYKKSSIQSEC